MLYNLFVKIMSNTNLAHVMNFKIDPDTNYKYFIVMALIY